MQALICNNVQNVMSHGKELWKWITISHKPDNSSYRAVNNSNYGWRALRLLARRSPHFFQPTNQQFKSLPEYLENMVIKLAKELPVSNILQLFPFPLVNIICFKNATSLVYHKSSDLWSTMFQNGEDCCSVFT